MYVVCVSGRLGLATLVYPKADRAGFCK
jgi:hypothetical protein